MNSPVNHLNEQEPDASTKVPYGNYRQPVRLVWRMLTSGNRVAVSSLVREVSKRTIGRLDWMLSRSESRTLQQPHSSTLPLILVVGAPRSGTTLVYQTIAQCAQVCYFSNLTDLFPHAPLTATRIFSRRFGTRRVSFQSYFGQTGRLSDPNEGFTIWNRWLSSDRYTTPTQLPTETMSEMLQFFQAWTSTFQLPFLNKNNRNTSCIALLSRALPTAKFVVVRRDPLYVAQSLLHARKTVQGDKRTGWGLQSRSVHAPHNPLGYVDDVCDQIKEIEMQLQSQLNQIDTKRIHLVQYEDFCGDPAGFLKNLQTVVPELQLRDDVIRDQLKPFVISKSQPASSEELERLRHFSHP
jgi:hypothetical protein